MKFCKVCGLGKPFDQHGATPKWRGFTGNVCWSCYVRAQRLRARGLNPDDIELDTALEAQRQAQKELSQSFVALRAARTLERFSPENIALEHARIGALEREREQKYEAWVLKQRAKNEALLKQQAKSQERLKQATAWALETQAKRTADSGPQGV